MIPFASSRGLGQDLATHLQNAQDNEYVEIADMRGAVARDLHGAFAEWEFQAQALTRCERYLYSLSINPDQRQGKLTREQYLDYIDRTEKKLGLEGQPRAVVFHIKDGREHAHVVWSRIMADEGKAVHLAFDKEKLMMVTREFARDHGLTLPDGYFKDKAERGKSKQATLNEMHQQRATGITKQERMDAITGAWRQSDNPKAFVAALTDMGYILATGRRPYVLVDIYGHENALPRMINDKQVRAKDVQAFLKTDFPSDSLPSVDEAKKLAADHRKDIKTFEEVEHRAAQIDLLKGRQAERRGKVEAVRDEMTARQSKETKVQSAQHRTARRDRKAAYLREGRRIRDRRSRFPSTGLAAFLGRVTGVELLRATLHKYQDGKRSAAYAEEKDVLAQAQAQERDLLTRRHELQAINMNRELRGLDRIEKRERQSLESSLTRQGRVSARGGDARGPKLTLELKPKGRRAVPHKAMNRYRNRLDEAVNSEAINPDATGEIDLTGAFGKASGSDESGGDDDGAGKGESSKGPQPKSQTNPKAKSKTESKTKIRRYAPKKNRDRDRGR